MSYAVSPQRFDEAFREDGTPRPGYGPVIEWLAEDPRAASNEVERRLTEERVEFGSVDSGSVFAVDPVPRLFTAEEWQLLEAGLIQRMSALKCFLADAYGRRELIEAGVLPERILAESRYYEPIMAEIGGPPQQWVAGPDIVRDVDGNFRVLEDNMRTPSGLCYALAGRRAVRDRDGAPLQVCPLEGALDALLQTLRRADPRDSGDPRIALLSDGESSSAWYEHHEIAERLGLALVRPDELSSRRGRLGAKIGESGRQIEIDVLYNRSSQESLRDSSGRLSALGQVLAEPLRRRTLTCVNFFGMGIADDKALFGYVDSIIRHFLGEEPILPSIATFDLGEPANFADQIRRIDELVIKPRWSFGGHGIVLGPEATPQEVADITESVQRAPSRFVAQEAIDFSVHPTVAGDHLEPRHVDLRPFVLSDGEGFTVVPGGLTRFAGERAGRIVNSTQGGGAKDTWVLN